MSSSRSLTAKDRALALAALEASRRAYAPYSAFAVGAALRAKSGRVHTGANIENAAYGVTICAEMSAISTAYGAGDTAIESIAVAGHKFEAPLADGTLVSPCGRCRQIILECAQMDGRDIRVLSCSGDLRHISADPISKLLPLGFGPKNLGLTAQWPRRRDTLEMRTARLAKAAKARVTRS